MGNKMSRMVPVQPERKHRHHSQYFVGYNLNTDEALSKNLSVYANTPETPDSSDHIADAGKMVMGVKADNGKARFDLIPPLAERAMAEVLTFGAAKYSPDNWRKVESAIERYTAAALRHINQRRAGEYLDHESQKPHMAHAMCCIAYVLELEQESRSERGCQTDDGDQA